MSGYLLDGQWHEGWYDTGQHRGRVRAHHAQVPQLGSPPTAPAASLPNQGATTCTCRSPVPGPIARSSLRVLKQLQRTPSPFPSSSPSCRPRAGRSATSSPITCMAARICIRSTPGHDRRTPAAYLLPVLWDKKTRTDRQQRVERRSSACSTASSRRFARGRPLTIYPAALRPQIDEVNDFVYNNVNNGVYRCGFAADQVAYERAVNRLFTALDRAGRRLSGTAGHGRRASSLPRRTGGSSPRFCASMRCTSVTSSATATVSKTSRTSRASCARCIGSPVSRQR